MTTSDIRPPDETVAFAHAVRMTSESQFRTLVQNSSDVVLIIAPEGTVTYASPALRRVLGREPESLEGAPGLDFVHPDDLEEIYEKLLSLADPGAHLDLTFRARHADGGWRWIEASTTNLTHHPHIGGLVCNFRDVTEWHLAQEALRASEARFRALAEHSGSLIEVISPDGEILWVSPSLPRVFGWHHDLVIGQFAGGFCHPDDADEPSAAFMECLTEDDTTTSATFRVRHADGLWRWVEAIFTNRVNDPAVGGVVANIIDISQRKALERRLTHQATHDPLTGLPNRTLLVDRLDSAIGRAGRQGQQIAVLSLDLDNFKVINDSLGHALGDQLLTAVASRLEAALRPSDSVARFGGDEFVVLCEELDNPEDVIVIADRILDAVNRPLTIGGTEVFVGVSIGVVFPRSPTIGSDELLRDADAAMYEAKKRGRARWVSFDDGMRADVADRLDVESALRHSLDRHELRVFYQPILAVGSGLIEGVEALVRWEHPERGLLLPGEFIEIAEDTGLIVPLGSWVLDHACRQVQRWMSSWPTDRRFTLAVNLSARQLSHLGLVDDVAAILDDTGMDPSRITLEVTESVLMHDVAMSADTLSRLKGLGVDIAVDDFGTGYSSLTHLRTFPVDLLKVDQSFVSGLGTDTGDSAIVEAVVNLAHTLGLEAVAEGVETEEQLAGLRSLGCDYAQGFLLGRPGTAHEVGTLLGLPDAS